LLLSVSIVLSVPFAKWLYACAGGEDPYDYFASFFLNDVNKDPAYRPFRYTSYLTYYDDWWQPEAGKDTTLPDQNISEWHAYTSRAVKPADIDSFVYKFSYEQLKNLYFHLEKNTTLSVPPKVKNNGMTQWFLNNHDLEALGYLMFAKQCEPLVSDNGNAWEPAVRDSVKMSRMIKNGLQLHAAAKKDFLQWRYAFQVLRLAYYSGQNQKTLELYGQLIGDKTNETYIYARVLGLKAGALFRTGQKQQAAYLYSRVFDLSDNMKRSAHISFNWAVNADSRQVTALCQNNHEKAVVYIMDGLYQHQDEPQSSLQLLEQAYALDPQIRGLDMVMTRAINQIEEQFLDEKLRQNRNLYSLSPYGSGAYYDEAAEDKKAAEMPAFQQQISALAGFAATVAQAGNNGTPAFWWLANSYLNLLNRNTAAAYTALQAAEKMPLTPRQKDQANIIRALYYVYQQPALTPASEKDLLPLLQWMEQNKEKDEKLASVYRYLLNGVLASSYLQQQDTTKMVLSLSRLSQPEPFGTTDYGDGYVAAYAEDFTNEPGRYLQIMSMERLAQLKSFVSKNGASSFDRWLVQSNLYSPSVLSEMEGTRYLRMLEFGAAVKAFQAVKPAELQQRLLPDPFVLHIRDYQEWDKHDSANSYTKLRFAQEMARLQQEAARQPGDAAKTFLYGLGLYSMTHYGRAAHAFTYYRSGSDGYAYFDTKKRQALPASYQNYYGATAAAQVFEAAAAATTDPELKAKCYYMLALCWQKNIPDLPRDKYGYAENEEVYFVNKAIANPWFAELRRLQSTAFYKTAVTRCSYLGDYVRKQR